MATVESPFFMLITFVLSKNACTCLSRNTSHKYGMRIKQASSSDCNITWLSNRGFNHIGKHSACIIYCLSGGLLCLVRHATCRCVDHRSAKQKFAKKHIHILCECFELLICGLIHKWNKTVFKICVHSRNEHCFIKRRFFVILVLDRPGYETKANPCITITPKVSLLLIPWYPLGSASCSTFLTSFSAYQTARYPIAKSRVATA